MAIEGIFYENTDRGWKVLIEGQLEDDEGDIIARNGVWIETSSGSYIPFSISFYGIQKERIYKYQVKVKQVRPLFKR